MVETVSRLVETVTRLVETVSRLVRTGIRAGPRAQRRRAPGVDGLSASWS